MKGMFRPAKDVAPDVMFWGVRRWVCHPQSTGAKDLTVIDVTLGPGQGHNFHRHPGQEEVIYVVAGSVEQWVDREKRLLAPGDSVFIPGDMVHASFNAGSGDAKMLAILGPCLGPEGYQVVEVAGEAPWNKLRA